MPRPRTAGGATVEHVGLVALVALLAVAGAAALIASPPSRSTRELGEVIGRRIACVSRHPVPCGRNPLALAYGFPVGKLVRALAPEPVAVPGPGGVPLLPVDFRRCRRESCAVPGPREGLTASARTVTIFTSVQDRRASGGGVVVSFWLYRPSMGWERIVRSGDAGDVESASETRLTLEQRPALVPLETLPGRNHYEFPRSDEPPWRWLVPSVVPG